LAVLQVPPVAVSVRVIVEPVQTDEAPEIEPALGNGLTVIDNVSLAVPHEVRYVYEITAAPAALPVTAPVVLTLAMEALLLLQIPPEIPLVKEVVLPAHTAPAPAIVPPEVAGEVTFRIL
jgi:hypothetical protein